MTLGKSTLLWMRREWGIAPNSLWLWPLMSCLFWDQAFPFCTSRCPHMALISGHVRLDDCLNPFLPPPARPLGSGHYPGELNQLCLHADLDSLPTVLWLVTVNKGVLKWWPASHVVGQLQLRSMLQDSSSLAWGQDTFSLTIQSFWVFCPISLLVLPLWNPESSSWKY